MIGNKRERISITVTESVRDSGGGVMPSVPSVYWDTFAEVKTIKNARNAQAYVMALEEPKEFIIRYRADKHVTDNMLIHHDGLVYTIQSNIDVDVRKRFLTLVGLVRK